MTDLAITNTFVSGNIAVAADVNENFQDVVDFVNTTGVPVVQDGAVSTAAKLASGVVTTAKIADANVTEAKLAADAMAQYRVVHSASANGQPNHASEFVLPATGALSPGDTALYTSAGFYFDPADYDTAGKSLQLIIQGWCITQTDPTDTTLEFFLWRATGYSGGVVSARSSTNLTNGVSLNPVAAANTRYAGVSSANAPTTAGHYFVTLQHTAGSPGSVSMTYGYNVLARVQ